MDAGPDGVEAVVRQLLRTAPAAAAAPSGEPAGPPGQTLSGPAQPAPHRLPPMGCRGAPVPGLGAVGGAHGGADGRREWPRAVDGIHWAAGSGIGLGAHAAGAPATAWRHVAAVLNLGALQHPG